MNLSLIKINRRCKEFSFDESAIIGLSGDEINTLRLKLNETVSKLSKLHSIQKRKNEKVHCEICGDSVDKYYYVKHLTMSNHIKKVREMENKYENGGEIKHDDVTENAFCNICNEFMTPSDYENHIQTIAHLVRSRTF